MASRTSAGTATVVTITIFGILMLGFFVTSVVFYSKWSRAEGEVAQLQTNYEEIIRTGERTSDTVQAALRRAREDRESDSLVDYLLRENNELTRIATGSTNLTSEQVRERVAEVAGSGSVALTQVVSRLESDVASRDAELASAQERLDRLQADINAELARIRAVEQSAQATAAEATDRVGGYRDEVSGLRTRVEGFEQRVQREIAADRGEYQNILRDREDQIAELNQQVLVLQDQNRRLRGEGITDSVKPLDEYALVDGEVAAVTPSDSSVVITLGRNDKLVIGMTFAVYSSAAEIRPTPGTSIYGPGKAVIEVIGMDESSARCRVVRASRGNPVIVGDVIANPVYDPDKTYKFVVFGEFDVNHDGNATPYERDALVAVIERWGGEVIDEITGDLDFLVLGRRPSEPLQPAPNAPRPIYEQYLREKAVVDRYQDLFEDASNSSIPVLNENRLRTLIGEFPR